MDIPNSSSHAANLVKELDVLVSEEKHRLYAATHAPELLSLDSPPLAMLVALQAFLLGTAYGKATPAMQARVEAHFGALAQEILNHAAERAASRST